MRFRRAFVLSLLFTGVLAGQTITPVPLPANAHVSYFHLWRNMPVGQQIIPPRQDYQTVDRAASTCTADPATRVCLTIWVIDRVTNAGLAGVRVIVNDRTLGTNGAGLVVTSVRRNQVFTLRIANVTGYTPSPIIEGLSKTADTHAILGLLELAPH
mgnify:CR=1 FL=1